MRTIAKTAALIAFAAAGMTASAAFAGPDEAGQNSFWSHQSVSSTPAAQSRSTANERYRATYAAPESQAPAASTVTDPPYFYHAMGSMSSH